MENIFQFSPFNMHKTPKEVKCVELPIIMHRARAEKDSVKIVS